MVKVVNPQKSQISPSSGEITTTVHNLLKSRNVAGRIVKLDDNSRDKIIENFGVGNVAIPMQKVLDILGIRVMLASISAIEGREWEKRIMALEFANRVAKHMPYELIRPLNAADKFIKGNASAEELAYWHAEARNIRDKTEFAFKEKLAGVAMSVCSPDANEAVSMTAMYACDVVFNDTWNKSMDYIKANNVGHDNLNSEQSCREFGDDDDNTMCLSMSDEALEAERKAQEFILMHLFYCAKKDIPFTTTAAKLASRTTDNWSR
ncbi:MAG: hypothetical protein FWD15_03225 [Alphaproteobacteria bacterium]|nr:hypothetical protein [Alphaproteobacteria bacterium]